MEITALNESLTNEYLEILAQRKYSFNTIRNYRSAYNSINKHLDNEKQHHDVTTADIIKFLKTQNHYSDQTFNSRLTALKSFYNYLIEIDVIDKLPITKYMYKRLHWEPPYALSEMDKLRWLDILSVAQCDQIIASNLMLATGMRLDEVINFDLKKDFEVRNNKGFIHIRKSKSKMPRICPIFDDKVTKKLIELKKLYFGFKSYKLNIKRHSFMYYTQLYFEKYNITISPHNLRYTFATERYYKDNLDINSIRLLLGHKSINTTLLYIADQFDVYALII